MRACPTEAQRIFLCTQIADEARHVRFFDRFFSEVGVLEGADELPQRLEALDQHINDSFRTLFDDLLKSRVDRLAREPEDRDALVEAITLYHMVIEGMLALTGQHFIIEYNERVGTLPAFVEGFSNVAREMSTAISPSASASSPIVSARTTTTATSSRRCSSSHCRSRTGVIEPPWPEEEDNTELFGASREETHAFAAQALSRRLKVIGPV